MMATDPIARTIRSTHPQLDWQLDWQRALLHMALRDDLTGLHNRRGFIPLATGYLRWARDAGQNLLMFFADVDGLKSINDRFGHSEGDRALARAAAGIRETFRQSDVTARLSGHEFAALVIETRGRSAGAVCRRLQSKLAECARAESRYSLSLNVGVAHFDPGKPVALHELMKQAEIALYRNKRRQRSRTDPLSNRRPPWGERDASRTS